MKVRDDAMISGAYRSLAVERLYFESLDMMRGLNTA